MEEDDKGYCVEPFDDETNAAIAAANGITLVHRPSPGSSFLVTEIDPKTGCITGIKVIHPGG
jgi:hypothetical protein